MSKAECALCDHDPACGVGGVTNPDDHMKPLLPLCHADDHSCYVRWTVDGERNQ